MASASISSDHADIFNNNVYRNCNGITGVQQDRPDGRPGLLEYVAVHDNLVAGPAGVTGAAEDNGANLNGRSITFSKDGFSQRNGLLCPELLNGCGQKSARLTLERGTRLAKPLSAKEPAVRLE